MRELKDIPPGTKLHAALARQVMTVLSVRPEGWCIYLDAVPGKRHDDEWQLVARQGVKQDKVIAEAILKRHYGMEPGDLRYIA